MLEKLNNWILERHIRKLLERYYEQFGITLEEAKTMSIYQLLHKIETRLEYNSLFKSDFTAEVDTKSKTDYKDNIIELPKISANKEKTSAEKTFEQTIRETLSNQHMQFGLSKEDIEKLSITDLLDRVNDRFKNADKEFNYYASVVSHLENKVSALTIENKEMKERMVQMKAENKGLNTELSKVREENYNMKLENSIFRERFNASEKEQSKAVSKDNSLSLAR